DGSITPLPPLWEEDVRMNQGADAPDGSFLCGTMAYDARPGGAAMWRLMPDGTTTRLFGDLTISNGLAFSADGARAFYVDTPTGRVDVFDWSDADGLVGRRPFADLTGEDGHPDGLCLDSAGNVWVAMHSGSQVLGLDEHGKVAERISVGATQVTACAFGGEDRGTLFITTSRENLADGDDPAAGSLFAARPGVHGPVDELLVGDGPGSSVRAAAGRARSRRRPAPRALTGVRAAPVPWRSRARARVRPSGRRPPPRRSPPNGRGPPRWTATRACRRTPPSPSPAAAA